MIQIITDSSCDLHLDRLKELGVICVPQTIQFGDTTYIDGENISTQKFFELLESESDSPKTALPSPALFEDYFKPVLDRGDEILGIFVGDQLSGTLNSARLAKAEIDTENKIRFADSGAVSVAVGLLVEIAVQKVKDGIDLDTLEKEMQEIALKTKVYGALDSLKYLIKGGRLSGPAALVGNMLNLCPIIANENGLVVNVTKVKGRKKLYSKMADLCIADGVDTNYPIIFGEAFSDDGSLDIFKELLSKEVDISNQISGFVGPIVGTFSGPRMINVAFVRK